MLGTTDVVTNAAAGLNKRQRYDVFGKRLDSGSRTLTRGFPGHEEDAFENLMNMKGRLYDPVLGQFLHPDPVHGGMMTSVAPRSEYRLVMCPVRPWLSAARSLAVAILAAFVLTAAAPGCAGAKGVALTPQEISTHGVAILHASPDETFTATVDALKVLGYLIALERRDKGLIVTRPKGVPDTTIGNRYTDAILIYSRQYTIEIKDSGDGSSRVIATPTIFENSVDISAQPLWDMGSPKGERHSWNQLFAKIKQLL